jgi:predicted ATP-dependent serine protease
MDRRAMVGGMSASCGHSHPPPTQPGLRRVLWLALAGNASMFALELASWLGKCPGCGAWNTLEEARPSRPPAAPRTASSRWRSQPVATLSEIEASDVERTPTGQEELDRVLGGGIVAGGVVLIGGDPGIGKSTLLLQALATRGRDALSRR